MKHIPLATALLFVALAHLAGADEPARSAATQPAKLRHASAKEVFDYKQTVLFQDNFESGSFGKWRFSENANYQIEHEDPARIKIVDAPDLPRGRKAVRFAVQRAPDSFRSEISLPHENGFQERWYGQRILVPREWVFDPARAVDIIMQWHAIPGNGKPTNPNLEISVRNDKWHIRQTYGDRVVQAPLHTDAGDRSDSRESHRKRGKPLTRGRWQVA